MVTASWSQPSETNKVRKTRSSISTSGRASPIALATERFEAWDLLALPFPYVERPVSQRRPALVVACRLGPHSLAWVLMITSAGNAAWRDDVGIPDHAAVAIPSVIRTAKIASVMPTESRRLGRLDPVTIARVSTILHARINRP